MQAFALKRNATCVSVVIAMDLKDATSKASSDITEIAQIGTGQTELTDEVVRYVIEVAEHVRSMSELDQDEQPVPDNA